MDPQLTEQEQVEAIKKWWAENGRSVIAGLVLGIAAVAGVRYWFHYQEQQSMAAGEIFARLQRAHDAGDSEGVLDAGTRLVTEYAGTPYATLGAFAMARVRVDADNLEAAERHLRWALEHAPHEGLEHLARLRLGRVLLAAGRAGEALALVSGLEPGGYAPDYAELRGDILAAQGKADEARAAYDQALAGLASGERRQAVEIKRDLLPPAPRGQDS